MLTVVVVFTATGGGITNDISQTLRIHSRYYNYLLPLLFIVLALSLEGKISYSKQPKIKFILVSIGLIFILYGLFTLFHPFTPNYVDGPEINGLIKNKIFFIILCLFNIALLILYIFKDKLSVKLFLFIYLPFSVLISNVYSVRDLNNRLYMSPFDRAAIAVKNVLPREDISRLIIIGPAPSLGILLLSQIHFDNTGVSAGVFDEKIPLQVNDFNKKIEWVLSIGEYSYKDKPITTIRGDGFLLSRIRANTVIDFRNHSLPLMVSSISGLGPPSHAGRWSVGKVVSITYGEPLPSDFNLKIKTSPYIGNVNKPIEIEVGGVTRELVLVSEMQESTVTFSGVKKDNSLRIKIANPLPESEGSIGVMFTGIEIEPIHLKKR
jgi:phosphoglycerol transferase